MVRMILEPYTPTFLQSQAEDLDIPPWKFSMALCAQAHFLYKNLHGAQAHRTYFCGDIFCPNPFDLQYRKDKMLHRNPFLKSSFTEIISLFPSDFSTPQAVKDSYEFFADISNTIREQHSAFYLYLGKTTIWLVIPSRKSQLNHGKILTEFLNDFYDFSDITNEEIITLMHTKPNKENNIEGYKGVRRVHYAGKDWEHPDDSKDKVFAVWTTRKLPSGETIQELQALEAKPTFHDTPAPVLPDSDEDDLSNLPYNEYEDQIDRNTRGIPTPKKKVLLPKLQCVPINHPDLIYPCLDGDFLTSHEFLNMVFLGHYHEERLLYFHKPKQFCWMDF